MNDIDRKPEPTGELALKVIAMPVDTNAWGDIFGGWLLMQMDKAGSITAEQQANGRVATVAVDRMSFMVPLSIGDVISLYTTVVQVGSSSIQVNVEVWATIDDAKALTKVTDGQFVYVAIDDSGNTRVID